MKLKPSIAVLSIFLLGAAASKADAVWQWSAATDGGRAFLWIPENCLRVRAIVFGQNNMIEEGILQHREFRKAMAALGIAEVFVAPTFDTWQNATNNDIANEKFNALLKQFADESGYGELKFTPIVPIGHSAMASFPWNFAAWNPQRTLAILSVHGDAPQTKLTGNSRPNLNWGDRDINGVPGLMVMGEYEWWVDRLTPAIAFRAKFPQTPVAILCDAGHGHFDYSDELVHFLAMFIHKAAEQRLPVNAPSGGPVTLKAIDPKRGWLVDCYRKNQKPRAAAAPYTEFAGDRSEAFWSFDREMSKATENFNPQIGKKPQLVGIVQDGKIVDQTPNTPAQIYLKLPPLDDSLTFHLSGGFLDRVPDGNNPAKWTGLTNGASLTHAANGGPVRLSRITGPVEQLSDDTFAIRFNRFSIPSDRRMGDIWLLASHPGDAHFKSAVQQALLAIPKELTEGRSQKIVFAKIPDQKIGVKSLKLQATCDSGAPVHYYVREGPAIVSGDELRFTRIPPRTRFPLRVTVVAWQYGRTVGEKLESAEPIEQTFYIGNPGQPD